MSEVKWTEEQEKVIALRNRSLLVSAAAGSGKTAVLVERILTMITEGENPPDVDQLLVVTFTNAAAAQMREKIQKAITKRLEADPQNRHLKRQQVLIRQAKITTIDSFCLSIVREQFHRIDLDPSFRIADKGELRLLKEDILKDLLEEEHTKAEHEKAENEKADPDFLRFWETFNEGREDGQGGELILALYDFANGNPRPESWLEKCRKSGASSVEELLHSEWLLNLCRETKEVFSCLADQEKELLRQYEQMDGADAYCVILREEAQMLEAAAKADGYEEIRNILKQDIFYQKKPRKSKKDIFDQEKAKELWDKRDSLKKNVQELKEQSFALDPEALFQVQCAAKGPIETLITLTEKFAEKYREAKQKKNIQDFSDIEHKALQILSEEQPDGSEVPTEIAREYAERYREIMIDEYQDSNYVQELILTSISKESDGQPNIFMVGDVKQSIYRFRLARPELFMQKYSTFTETDSPHQKIELNKNFRSRAEVLSGVNFIFAQIMHERLGNVEYTEKAALHPGAEFKETGLPTGKSVKLLLLDTENAEDPDSDGGGTESQNSGSEDAENSEKAADAGGRSTKTAGIGKTEGSGGKEAEGQSTEKTDTGSTGTKTADAGKTEAADPETANAGGADSERAEELSGVRYNAREWEAVLIAREIRRLTDEKTGVCVWDSEQKCYRRAEYRDVTILLRSIKGWADDFLPVLAAHGIPAAADSGTGYFSAQEVQNMISLLQIVDNPLQDVPLAGVLHSPIGRFTGEELAKIRLAEEEASSKEALLTEGSRASAFEGSVSGEKKVSLSETSFPDAAGDGSKTSSSPAGDGTILSPSLSAEDAAAFPVRDATDGLYGCLLDFAAAGKEDPLSKKVRAFLVQLADYRKKAEYLPLHELVHYCMTDSGYFEYVGALPGGKRRRANLEMLEEKAEAFEKTSYHGVFSFMQYLDRLKTYNEDDPEASEGENANVVRIMSIHKSKGLEFPIVIAAGLGKQFNLQDTKKPVLFHEAFGIAADAFYLEDRTKVPSPFRKFLANQIKNESLGEELRVLYVAMTRAKEILILSGSGKNLYTSLPGKLEELQKEERELSFLELTKAKSCLDWIIGALGKHGCFRNIYAKFGLPRPDESPFWKDPSPFDVTLTTAGELGMAEAGNRLDMAGYRKYLDDLEKQAKETGEEAGDFAERFEFDYHYDDMYRLAASRSVSEARRILNDYEEEEAPFIKKTGSDGCTESSRDKTVYTPAFLRDDEKPEGAERGTLYHTMFEHLNPLGELSFAEQMDRMKEKGMITDLEREAVKEEDIRAFYETDLGKRVVEARKRGEFHAEYPFCIGVPAEEIYGRQYDQIQRNALVKIHGVVDAWFTENGKVILYDYKTDGIGRKNWEDWLRDEYGDQLRYYKRALEKITGMKVAEVYLYSVSGRKCVKLEI